MHSGRCLCGAVTIEIDAEPIGARTCWCRVCQYIGAGNATVNVVFPTSAVKIEGALGDHVSTADSGSRMHRRFCLACGTHLFSEAESRPNLIIVRAGALDDREIFRPQSTIWTGSAPSWACIDPDLPHVEGQPPPL